MTSTAVDEAAKPRSFRSKLGCTACKRRKVRCNERRPRCGHCERLNLECTWDKLQPSRRVSTQQSRYTASENPTLTSTAPSDALSGVPPAMASSSAAYLDFSDMGTMAWDEAMLLSPDSWPSEISGFNLETFRQLPPQHDSLPAQISSSYVLDFAIIDQMSDLTANLNSEPEPSHRPSSSPFSNEGSSSLVSRQDDHLVDTFLRMFMPPILVPVEIGPKWTSTRAFFASMAEESFIVRSAIKAFAAMQIQRKEVVGGRQMSVDWQALYEIAHQQLSVILGKRSTITEGGSTDEHKAALKHILASLFLLTYTDLLTKTLPRAHANLRDAYGLLRRPENRNLTAHERRLISWIRLLDARAVSTAGGEGLFLADGDESLFDASPMAEPLSETGSADTTIEEILFDVLYHPGIVFYQKVQSFVGRITRIDPWHRSRGTVQDETEVMAIGEQISKDLEALYNQRPALLDHCVAGNLTDQYLARDLAAALTRSFRTYLANYYASFIHLHRVAYVQYSKTDAVNKAIENIKSLSHSMAQTDQALPVNLLWPLLMWGCEEDSPPERKWILDSIRSLEDIATNAKVTADLLEEVQKRQDQAKRRVDVRSVSHECFASYHFAIV